MGELLRLPGFAIVALVLSAGMLPALAQDAAAEPAEADAAASKDSAPAADATGDDLKPSDLWVLDFRPVRIGMIQPTEGIHQNEVYWYLVYRIENRTGKERSAYVSLTARSNKGKTYAGIYVPDIETMVERKVGKPLWGKADVYSSLPAAGTAEEGKKDSRAVTLNYTSFKDKEVRDCVAIFNQLDPNASKIAIPSRGSPTTSTCSRARTGRPGSGAGC